MQGISAIEVATKNCKRFAWASVCEEAATRRTADGRAEEVKEAEGTAQKNQRQQCLGQINSEQVRFIK